MSVRVCVGVRARANYEHIWLFVWGVFGCVEMCVCAWLCIYKSVWLCVGGVYEWARVFVFSAYVFLDE